MNKNSIKAFLCCGGCVLNIGLSYLFTNLVGLFCVPLATKLGVQYAQIAIIWTTLSLGAIASRSFTGTLFQKYNPKVVCAIAGIMFLIGLPGLTMVQSPVMAYVLFFFVGLMNTFTSSLPFQLLGSKWIGTGRGTIIGMTPIFSAIFSTLLAPIATSYAKTYGFEKTAMVAGVILVVCFELVTLLCLSREPAAYGMEPVNLKFLEGKGKKAKAATEIYETKMPISEITKLPVFWVMMVLPPMICVVQQAFYSNRTAILGSMGLDLTQVAYLVGFYSIGNCILTWLFGILCDKIGFRTSILMYAAAGAVLWFAWPGLKTMGLIGGMIVMICANVCQINNYFGPNVMIPLFGVNKSYTLTSWASMAASVGSLVAPVIVSVIGSYDTVLFAAAIVYVVVFVLMMVATRPSALAVIKEKDKAYVESHKGAAAE